MNRFVFASDHPASDTGVFGTPPSKGGDGSFYSAQNTSSPFEGEVPEGWRGLRQAPKFNNTFYRIC